MFLVEYFTTCTEIRPREKFCTYLTRCTDSFMDG